jgi:hypothetical protein
MRSFGTQSKTACAGADRVPPAPGSFIKTRVTLGVASATCCIASLLCAQTNDLKQAGLWQLQGLRSSYCVHFLVNPEAGSKALKQGLTAIRASEDATLNPALQQVVHSQPEFAGWTASNLCLYYLDAVQVGKQRIVERDPRRYQLIGVWTLAAREAGGARRDFVVDMYASRENLLDAAHVAEVRLHEMESAYYDHPDTTDDTYNLKIGKTQLIWTGRAVGDSIRVQQPLTEQWSMEGLRHGLQPVRLVLTPAWSRALVGSLRVEGKGDLAKLLKASPIRFVGPLYRGGGGELRFTR